MAGMHNLYFESAAMIVTLITVGKLLEALSKGRTTDALKSLMKLAPALSTFLKEDKNYYKKVAEQHLNPYRDRHFLKKLKDL